MKPSTACPPPRSQRARLRVRPRRGKPQERQDARRAWRRDREIAGEHRARRCRALPRDVQFARVAGRPEVDLAPLLRRAHRERGANFRCSQPLRPGGKPAAAGEPQKLDQFARVARLDLETDRAVGPLASVEDEARRGNLCTADGADLEPRRSIPLAPDSRSSVTSRAVTALSSNSPAVKRSFRSGASGRGRASASKLPAAPSRAATENVGIPCGA